MKYVVCLLLCFSFNARAEDSQDLSQILKDARAVPHSDTKSGEIKDYKFIEQDDNGVYSKLGLKKMDVIKSVDGKATSSPQQAMEMFNVLKKSGTHKIEIERDGKIQQLNYQVK